SRSGSDTWNWTRIRHGLWRAGADSKDLVAKYGQYRSQISMAAAGGTVCCRSAARVWIKTNEPYALDKIPGALSGSDFLIPVACAPVPKHSGGCRGHCAGSRTVSVPKAGSA